MAQGSLPKTGKSLSIISAGADCYWYRHSPRPLSVTTLTSPLSVTATVTCRPRLNTSALQQDQGRAGSDCFRIASELHFTFNDGSGELKRPSQGLERLTLHITKGEQRGEWVAEAKPNGVAWTKNGKAANDVPQSLARLYQRLTIFPDPQKKEGSAQRVGDHFEFTDANSGDRYVVEVSAADGSISELRINDLVMTFGR